MTEQRPVDAAAIVFDPAKEMISLGKIKLNKISMHLHNFRENAEVELLVSPQDVAAIFGRDHGTWIEDILDIRRIDDSHGIHFDGQFLKGMPVFDHCEQGHNKPIEKEIVQVLQDLWITNFHFR